MQAFGGSATKMGTFHIRHAQCSSCKMQGTQKISVFGRYSNFFFIPFFPLGKSVIAECVSCKRTIREKDFSPSLTEQYEQNKAEFKRPLWHWSGFALIGLLFIVSQSCGETDARHEFLKKDMALMTQTPDRETDSLSFAVKEIIDFVMPDEFQSENFKYYSHIKEDKALVLVQIPDLKKLEKETRKELLQIIKTLTWEREELNMKQIYIGIHGKFNLMIAQTPKKTQNTIVVPYDLLYDFYTSETK